MQNKIAVWAIALTTVLPALWPERVAANATNSAVVYDWQDTLCRISRGGAGVPAPEANHAGGNQAYCRDCPPPGGMPRWQVSEPYINLFVTDEPLSYYLSSGQKMAFRWHYKQRFEYPKQDQCPNLYTYGGSTGMGRMSEDHYFNDMRTHSMTNAAWGHNWMMEVVVWDTIWESAVLGTSDPLSVAPVFSKGIEALVLRPEGGIYYLQWDYLEAPSVLTDPQSGVRLEPVSAYPLVPTNATPDGNGIYWGDAGMGFALAYPDGSQDIFSLVFYSEPSWAPPTCYRQTRGSPPITTTTGANSTTHAFLTQRIDPQGRTNSLGYEQVWFTNAPVPYHAYRLRYVVDPDGRTNTFQYNTSSPRTAWQASEIDDPFGGKATFGYDWSSGVLKTITDAASNTNSFAYQDASGWMSNFTTPYGPTRFTYYQLADTNVTGGFSQRAALITEPQQTCQLFCFLNHASGLPTREEAPTDPLSPFQFFDDGSGGHGDAFTLDYRNSFHWDRRQYGALSGAALAALTNALNNPASFGSALAALSPGDLNKATLKHWLWQNDGTYGSISSTLSSERAPSADSLGSQPGPRTWYDYANKFGGQDAEGDPQIACVARLLPDGSSQWSFYAYNFKTGLVEYNAETYSLPNGSVGYRTNWFTYPLFSIDLSSITNSAGQWVTFGYNSSHQVTSITNALNQVTGLAWDYDYGSLNLTGVWMPSGQIVNVGLYSGDWNSDFTQFLWSTNRGFVQTISYTPQGLTVEFPAYTRGLPQVIHTSGTSLPDLWVTNFWDGLNRLTGTAYPDGTTTSNRYTRLDLTGHKDRLGNWTHFAYDGLQHLTNITDALTNTVQLGWCGCGSLTEIVDALNQTNLFFYNNQGLRSASQSADQSWLVYQYDALGRLANVTQTNGQGFGYLRNNQGLVTGVTNAFGPVSSAGYDSLDRLLSITNAEGVFHGLAYDLLNRATNVLWPDNLGESFLYSANGLVATTNRNGRPSLFTRDAAGRLLGETNANQEVTALAYNALGQPTDLWDGNTHHTGWAYSEYGWPTNKVDARGSNTVRLAYDPNGRLTNRWTPQFGNTVYSYDPVGRLTNVAYPGTSFTPVTYAYDPNGRLTNMVDATGAIRFGYTPAGQRQSESGPWGSDTVSITYTNRLRQTLSVAQPGGANWGQTYAYDAAFRLQAITAPMGSFNYGYSATAPASSLVQSLVLPNNTFILYGYDSLDWLRTNGLFNRWGDVLDGYTYLTDPAGLRTNLTRSLGMATNAVTIGYDAIGQVTSWSASEATNGLRLNEQFGFRYDPAHNLYWRTNGAQAQTFTSDAANQLTNVTQSGTLTVSGATPVPATNVTVNGQPAARYGDMTFAAPNNPLTNGPNTFTVVARNIYGASASNTLTLTQAPVSLRYDLNGNLQSDGTRWFAYDPENELISVWVTNAWRTDFVYDGLGRRRIERDYGWQGGGWSETNETRFLYDGLLVIQERDGNNAVKATYTRGLDVSGSLAGAGGIGGLLARSQPGSNGLQHFYYHTDACGNITSMFDGQGTMAARYLYGPFGRLTAHWGPMASVNPMQFSSMPRHANSGLSLYPARAYDPSLQRWLTRDPLGEAGGMNLYGFVGNDAIGGVDPYGLNWFTDWWHNLWHIHGGSTTANPDSLEAIESSEDIGATPLTDENGRIVRPGDTLENALLAAGVNIAMMGVGGPEDKALYDAATEAFNAARAARAARIASCSWKSTKQFGHTFLRHGSKRPIRELIDRARSLGPQGRWLDNQKAADFLSQSLGNLPEVGDFELPPGLGEIVNADGSIVPAVRVRIVPSATGLTSAFPIP